MSSSEKVETHYFDRHFDLKEHLLHLSIQYNKGNIYFAYFDPVNGKYIGLEHQKLNDRMEWSHSANALKEILAEKFSNKQFLSVSFTYIDNLYTLVPKELFAEASKKDLLWYAHEEPAYLVNVQHNFIESNSSVIVYALPQLIANVVLQQFPRAKFFHFGKSLIESCLKLASKKEEQLFVHVQDNRLDICFIKNNKLIFFNSFAYQSVDDFIYYLMFVMEQLNLDPNACPVLLAGEILEDSELYQTLYKYIRTITLADRPSSADYSSQLNQIPKQFYFNLYNQYLCE